ncbi:MAG: hypothetical protein ACI3XT_08830 [Butyricicoccaceae bacterium]
MYNRYINADGFTQRPDPADWNTGQPQDQNGPRSGPAPAGAEPSAEPQGYGERPRGLAGLRNLLGSSLKLPDLNSDTLLLLAMVYFLVADPEDKISDTVLIIAALFLMGM